MFVHYLGAPTELPRVSDKTSVFWFGLRSTCAFHVFPFRRSPYPIFFALSRTLDCSPLDLDYFSIAVNEATLDLSQNQQ